MTPIKYRENHVTHMIRGPFTERSFPLLPEEIIRVPTAGLPGITCSTRAWLREVHGQLQTLLPEGPATLLTEDLVHANGEAADVFAHFGIRPEQLPSLRHNWQGLAHTAQASGANSEEEKPTPPWPGFEDIWIPIGDNVELCGRIRYARREGEVINTDCIVILPGILGDNNVLRTRDLAQGLVASGFHAMALELRGHGETARGRPEIHYNFGTLETFDLLAVSRWLEAQPHVRRTGLVGFCWGANHALAAAWLDGCRRDHPSISPRLAPHVWHNRAESGPPAHHDGTTVALRHWNAGILAFSPVLRFEELLELLERRWSRFRHPVLAGLQTTILNRMKRRGYPEPSGSLMQLIRAEFARSPLIYAEAIDDGLQMLRFLPYRGLPDHAKLQSARVPVLIVHGANDPMARSQDVADLIARTTNPMVAAMVLPGGGHVGFAAYAKAYYYSLVINFFAGAAN